ncbi:hypothetical protein PVIIG_04127 [Plasmodium vivax India VII]|uniref:VIR protein n=1 Tax=Plasmodium vivax India VII TaxID=1077284 RepID=A0A0J9S9S9_PLAVI|nr:hypothetical protein PVIIG_04127 [Plasmodium vivax India VII]
MAGYFRGYNRYADILRKYDDRSCVDNYHRYKEEIETKINEFYRNGNGKGNFCQKCNSVRQEIIKRNDDLNYYCKNHPLYGKFIHDNEKINDFITQCPELSQCRRQQAHRDRKPVPPKHPTVGHCKQNGPCHGRAVPTERVGGKAKTEPVIVSPGIRKPGEKDSLGVDTSYGEDGRTTLAEVVSNSQEGRMHSRSSSSMHVDASEPNIGHPSSTPKLGQLKTQHLSALSLSASSAVSGGHGGYSAQTSTSAESGAFAVSKGKTLETKNVPSQLGNVQHIRDNRSYAQTLDGRIVDDPVQVDTDPASIEAVNRRPTGIPIIGRVSNGEGAHFNALNQEATGGRVDLSGVPSRRIPCSRATDGINHCSEEQYDGTHSAENHAAGDDTQRTYLRGENTEAHVGQVPSLALSQETQAVVNAADSTHPYIGVAAQFPQFSLQKLTNLKVERPEELALGQQVHLGAHGQPNVQLHSNKEKFPLSDISLDKVVKAQLERGKYSSKDVICFQTAFFK